MNISSCSAPGETTVPVDLSCAVSCEATAWCFHTASASCGTQVYSLFCLARLTNVAPVSLTRSTSSSQALIKVGAVVVGLQSQNLYQCTNLYSFYRLPPYAASSIAAFPLQELGAGTRWHKCFFRSLKDKILQPMTLILQNKRNQQKPIIIF